MKMLTLNVDGLTYAEFKKHAKAQSCPTAEIIREAMNYYLEKAIKKKNSLWELQASSVGRVLRPIESGDEDLLEEMLNDSRY